MFFYVNDGGVDTEAMRIDGATANVGIGTSNPSASLHIFDSDGLLGRAPEDSAQDLIIESDGNAGISIISGKGSIERGVLCFGHDDDSFAAGLVYNAHGDQLSLQTQQASNTIRIATGNNDESFIFSGFDFSGSLASTGSFGALIGDGSQLTGVTATPDATLVSGSFQGGGSTNISGSLTSTGSFGQLFLAGITGSSNSNALTIEHGRLVISSSIPEISFVDRDGTNISNGIQNYNGAMRLFTDTQAGHGGSNISFRIDGGGDSKEVARFNNKGLVINVGSQGTTAMDENFLVNGDAGITGSLTISGSFLPGADNTTDIGSASKRFQDVFAVQTTVGAVFETGLRSKGIGKEETGTIVVWRNGKLVPCDKSEDTMVMGVVKQGKDEPIVMGAEPVLVTGDVKEGDFITTSTKSGHGKKIESGYLLKKEMFGKVIAQALENASGNSSLIKCMIRKM